MKLKTLFLLSFIVMPWGMGGSRLARAEGAPAPLSATGWLQGRWSGEQNGLRIDATYTGIEAGIVLGTTKMWSARGLEFYEFESITLVNGELVLSPFPQGQVGVSFKATTVEANRLVFENPANDFPSRIIYEHLPDGRFLTRIEGTQNQQAVSEDFTFSKTDSKTN